MLLPFLIGLAILVLVAAALERKPDQAVDRHRVAHRLKYLALVPLGLMTAFLLLMGIGEMVGGDLSGVAHLIPAVPVVILMFLVSKQSAVGGGVLVILGLLAAIYYYGEMIRPQDKLQAALFMGSPFVVSGLLLLVAVAVARKASASAEVKRES